MPENRPEIPLIKQALPDAKNKALDAAAKFLLDKGTGNVVLNVKDGQVMKVSIQEFFEA